MTLSGCRPKKSLWMLIVMPVLFVGYEGVFAGNTWTPERLLAVPLFIVILLYFTKLNTSIFLTRNSLFLIVWMLVAFVASATSLVAGWSMKMYIAQLLAILFYFMTLWLRPDLMRIFLSWPLIIFVWFIGPALATIYLISFYHQLPGFILHWFSETGGGTRLRATLPEPNLLAVLLILVNLQVIALGYTRRIWWWCLLVGLHLSLVFTFSRVPWVAYFITLMLYFVLIKPGHYSNAILKRYILLLMVLSLALLMMGYLLYQEFGEHELIGRVHSLKSRFVMWGLAYSSFLDSPIVGNGVYSLREIYPYASSMVASSWEPSSRDIWISNLPLALLHDTGILGLIFFFAFFCRLIVRGFRSVRFLATRSCESSYLVRVGGGLVASGIGLFITGQTIPAHSLAFFWITMALIECYTVNAYQFFEKNHFETTMR